MSDSQGAAAPVQGEPAAPAAVSTASGAFIAPTVTVAPTGSAAPAPTDQPKAPAPTDQPKAPNTPTVAGKAEQGEPAAPAPTAAEFAAAQKARQDSEAKLNAVLTALGLAGNDVETDPVQAAKVANEQTREARLQLAVYRAAGTVGADPEALLDSASFLRASAGVDPDDAQAVTAAITEAVRANPRYAATAAGRVVPAVGDAAASSPPANGDGDWLRSMIRNR